MTKFIKITEETNMSLVLDILEGDYSKNWSFNDDKDCIELSGGEDDIDGILYHLTEECIGYEVV